MHYVAVLHHIVLALAAELSGGAAGRFAAQLHEVLILDDFGADEALLEVGVDDSGRLGRLVAHLYGPGAALVASGGEEGLQVEKRVCRLYEPHHSGLLEAYLFEEHFALLVILKLCYFGFDLCGDDHQLGVLALDGFADCFHIGVSGGCRCFVHVADVEDRLVGQQAELLGEFDLLGILGLNLAGIASLFQDLLRAQKQLQGLLGLLVAASLGLFLDLRDTVGDGLQVPFLVGRP